MFDRIVAKLKAFEVSGLSRRQLCDVTRAIAKIRGALDALEIRVAAAVEALGDKRRRCRVDAASRRSHVGPRSQAAVANGPISWQNMPNTARRLAAGEITAEHADALVRAAETTSAELVDSDERLLANAARRPADLASRDIRDWAAKRQRTSADREERYRQQRRNRSLAMFKGDDQMQVALCRSDDVTGELFRSRVEKLARRLRRQDQRDHETNQNATVRTWEQLRHDALDDAGRYRHHTEPSPPPPPTSPHTGQRRRRRRSATATRTAPMGPELSVAVGAAGSLGRHGFGRGWWVWAGRGS